MLGQVLHEQGPVNLGVLYYMNDLTVVPVK